MGRQRRTIRHMPPTTITPKRAFEAAHPGATLNFLSQPDAEYYTLLGTALASKAGPDVIWANGGAQAKDLRRRR